MLYETIYFFYEVMNIEPDIYVDESLPGHGNSPSPSNPHEGQLGQRPTSGPNDSDTWSSHSPWRLCKDTACKLFSS